MDAARWRTSAPRWLRWLAPVVVAASGAAVVAWVVADEPTIGVDPALYQHVGWRVTRGGVPYVDVWDINPPLTFALAALFALIAGGNVLLLHGISAAASVVATMGAVLLVGYLAADLTGDDVAGLAAGLAMLAVPEVYGLAPYGLRSQYFALLFGAGAFALARRERPLLAGASVAVAAGFWQPAGGAIPLVLGVTLQRSGRRGTGRAIGGGLAVAAATVLPFVAAGAAEAMVVETVLAPIVGQAPYTLLGRAFAVLHALGYAALLLPVAGYGWVRALADRERWWVPAGGLVYTGVALFLNMNGSLDLLLWLLFLALGVALAVDGLGSRRRYRRGIVALAVLAVLLGPAWHLAAPPPKGAVEAGQERYGATKVTAIRDHDIARPDIRTVYWRKLEPRRCHYRLSWTERRWILRTDATLEDVRCGQWPERWRGAMRIGVRHLPGASDPMTRHGQCPLASCSVEARDT